MWKYFAILFTMIIAYLLYSKRIKIIWKTFFHRGFKPNKNVFGVYCYTGKQGSSKTLNFKRSSKSFIYVYGITEESIDFKFA